MDLFWIGFGFNTQVHAKMARHGNHVAKLRYHNLNKT